MFKTIDEIGKRYRFSTTLPIIGDEEGLGLTSYQDASEHTAKRILEKLGSVSVLELCSGVGGTTVFLAKKLHHVYAVDMKPTRIEAAKINSQTFGVAEKVTFVCGDVLDEKLLSNFKDKYIKAVVTDVEWRDDLSHSLAETTPDIAKTIPSTPPLFEKINKLVCSDIIMHMAANTNKEQLQQLGRCEIEEMIYQGVVKFLNVYFGKLKNTVGVTRFVMS